MRKASQRNIFSVSIEKIRENPEIVLRLLKKNRRISLSVDGDHSDSVHVATRRTYSKEVSNMAEKAILEGNKRKKSRVLRKQAAEDYKKTEREIGKYL